MPIRHITVSASQYRPFRYTTLYRRIGHITYQVTFVSDIAIFVLKRDVKLQLTNLVTYQVRPHPEPPSFHFMSVVAK